jgi:hypothetical protein
MRILERFLEFPVRFVKLDSGVLGNRAWCRRMSPTLRVFCRRMKGSTVRAQYVQSQCIGDRLVRSRQSLCSQSSHGAVENNFNITIKLLNNGDLIFSDLIQ